MADKHIIAVDTYGAQRIKHPYTGKTVSAYKLGYTSAVMPVLLALYGENARDVSPKQASYRYLQIDADVIVRHGHILLTVSADELTKTIQITRQQHRAAAYLWRDQKWWELPDSTHADYSEPSYRVGPNFDPTGFRPPSPSTGERDHTMTGITAERSQREEGGSVWWWLHGDTYPHRDLLKQHGARWSGKRKSWYYIGAELPAAIQGLMTSGIPSNTEASDTELASPLLAIFGGQIVGKECGSNGDLIVKGENGVFATRTTFLNRHEQPETIWVFDLPPHFRVGSPLPSILSALQMNGAVHAIYNQQWRFEGIERVAALDALVESVSSTDDAPCTVDEAAQILGMPIRETSAGEPPVRLFTLTETVYARHELETTDGKPIPTGTRGQVILLYSHNAAQGWSYDVEFDGIGIGWCFERELTMLESIPGIKIERGIVVPPVAAPPPTNAEIPSVSLAIKRHLIDAGLQPVPLEPSAIVPEDGIETADMPDEEPTPAIRILKPLPMPSEGEPLDAVQLAIRTAKTEAIPSPPTVPISNGRMVRIEQAYVGELTGSITGQVFCYGWAVYEGICIFANMAGPRMGVEAIRAKLSKGEQVSVIPLDAPAVELTAGEGNSGMYHPYLHYLPEARFASLLLIHDWAVTPNYGGKAATFIFRTSNAQATAKLKYHVTQLVNIPLFDAWSAYLYDAGQKAMLVRKTHSAGGIDLLSVDLDVDAWTRLITGGLEQGIISLPDVR